MFLQRHIRCSTFFCKCTESCSWVFKDRIHKIHKLKEHMPLLSTGHLRVGYGYSLKITQVILSMQIQNHESSLGESLLTNQNGCCLPLLYSLQHRYQQILFQSSCFFFLWLEEIRLSQLQKSALVIGTSESKAGTRPCLSKHYCILQQWQGSDLAIRCHGLTISLPFLSALHPHPPKQCATSKLCTRNSSLVHSNP